MNGVYAQKTVTPFDNGITVFNYNIVSTLQNNHALGHNPHPEALHICKHLGKKRLFFCFFGNSTISKIDSVLMAADKRKETKPYCRVLSLYGAFVPIRIAAGAMPKVDG